MTHFSIRYATPLDAGLIADISRETFYNTFASQNTPEDMDKFMNEQFTREKLMAQVGAEGNVFIMAYRGSELVGYVRMLEGPAPEGVEPAPAIEIARIYAASSTVGKGVGSVLMERCIDLAREKGKQVIWLGVWERNQRAIDFYRKWGFEKFSQHGFLLGNDLQTDWLMKKILK